MTRATQGFLTATHWGNYLTRQESDGSITVSPVSQDSEPSPIGRSLASTQDESCRISQPMIRQGYYEHRRNSDTTQRGKEPFIAVSWDEALDIAAEALTAAKDAKGNNSIYGGSYGWASAGRFHHAQSQVHRFLRGFGGYTDSKDTYSYAAAEVLIPHILGMNAFQAGMEVSTTEEVVKHCKRIVYFGGAATRNMQVNPGGTGAHDASQHFGAIANAGIDVVNISPIRDDVNSMVRARWFSCRPNSDVAIMLAMTYTLIDEGLYDKDFVTRYCVGFDVYADYVMGKSDGIPKDPKWAEGKSEVPANEIATLARLMAADRCMIGLSFSVQRAEHGEQTYWAGIALASALGYIGLPGGGLVLGAGVGKMSTMQRKMVPFSVGSLPQGKNAVSDFIPLARVTDMLESPGGKFTYNGEDRTYPDIDLVYWVGGNPFHHHQDINRFRRAWSHPKTIITHEINWTTTARFADIVFPSSSPLEREDFAGGSMDNWLTPMRRSLGTYRDSRDDYSIFSGLAERLGFFDQFTEGRDAGQWVRHLYDVTQKNAAAVGVTLPSFDEFNDGPPLDLRPLLTDSEQVLERFRADPVGNPLATPSGKIEIFSQTISDFGYGDCVGHPAWYDKTEWLGSPLAQSYPFHLLSNQPATRLHSQFDHGITSQESKIQDREPMRINIEDARVRGIQKGDIVRVFNTRGSFLAGAILSEDLRQGVVQIATGAWYDMLDINDPLSLEIHGNPNAVTNDIGTSSLAQGPSANSCLVDIEKYVGPLPPLKVFTPPEIIENGHSRSPKMVSER
ncbi:molybdopterin-dependent oxidoreductase [Pseudomonas sp. NPDC087358]|uniref:molybdopterin-dependent oxidoreductase n=1 Tax=Pseudomonas sp. NPDC087358 TaxID=3364439 RepID=UPI00384C226A